MLNYLTVKAKRWRGIVKVSPAQHVALRCALRISRSAALRGARVPSREKRYS